MRYMLQVRFNGADQAISELPAEQQQAIFAEFEAIGRLPGVLDGNQLQPISTANTVRAPEGRPHIVHGPAVDSSVALDGYYLYDTPHLEAALALAARIPAARFGGTVEVRPVVER
jgi:hypothetical protein